MPQDDIRSKMAEVQFREPEVDKIPNKYNEYPEGIEKIKELEAYIDMVKQITRPGCSEEVLKVATDSMSSLVRVLSVISSTTKPRASL